MPSHHTVLCRYHYDPLDRLIGLKPSEQVELQRFYCKSRLATEIQGLAQSSIVQQGDLLLAQQQRQGDTKETALLATDQQRSVLHIVDERPRPPIAYSPYGHRRAESGLTSLLGFNGERRDAITGHYLLGNGYRAFNPVLMRFNSPDSLSPFDKGGLNAYAYCLGDPVNGSDPTGNAPWFLWTTKELSKESLVEQILSKPDGHRVYRVQLRRTFSGFELSKNLINPQSKAGQQLLQWRAPPRSHLGRVNYNPKTLQKMSAESLDRKGIVSAPSGLSQAIHDADPFNMRLMKVYSEGRTDVTIPRYYDLLRHRFAQSEVLSEMRDAFEWVNVRGESLRPKHIVVCSKFNKINRAIDEEVEWRLRQDHN